MRFKTRKRFSHEQIVNAVGRSVPTSIDDDFVEIQDNLSVDEKSRLNALLYPETQSYESMNVEEKLDFLAQKIGVLPE